MRKFSAKSGVLLGVNIAFKVAGAKFLNSDKSLVLEYLHKVNSSSKTHSALSKLQNSST